MFRSYLTYNSRMKSLILKKKFAYYGLLMTRLFIPDLRSNSGHFSPSNCAYFYDSKMPELQWIQSNFVAERNTPSKRSGCLASDARKFFNKTFYKLAGFLFCDAAKVE